MNYETSYLPEDQDPLEQEARRRALTSLQTMDGGMGAPAAPTPPVAPAPAPAPSPAPDVPSASSRVESYLSRLGNARQEVDSIAHDQARMAPAIQALAQDARRRDPVAEQRTQALIDGTDPLSQQSRYQGAERDARGLRTRNTAIGVVGALLGARPEAISGLVDSSDRPIQEFLARRRQEMAEQGAAQEGQDRTRRIGREDAADAARSAAAAQEQRSAAALADPASEQNKLFRETFATTFPGVEVPENLSLANTQAVRLLERAGVNMQELQATAAQRAAHLEDQMAIDANRSQLRMAENAAKRRGRGGSGGGGRAAPGQLAEQYVATQTALGVPEAQARAAAAVLDHDTLQRGIAGGTREIGERSEAAGRDAAARERTAAANREQYGVAVQRTGLANLNQQVSRVGRLVRGAGEDLPGFGQTGFLPNQAISTQGRDLRRAVNELLDTKLRKATGANAPESEVKTFRDILGISDLSTDDDLRSALRQAREYIRGEMLTLRGAYGVSPEQEQAILTGRSSQPDHAPAAPAAREVRMRTREGEVLMVPAGDVAEAESDGAVRL